MASNTGSGYSDNSIDLSRLRHSTFEMGAIRPPSEGAADSLLIRVTRNCPWSKCTFCYGRFYRRRPFEIRPVDEVKADIDKIKAISDTVKALSWQLGFNGNLEELGKTLPSLLLGEKDTRSLEDVEIRNTHCIINVFNWMTAGGKSVFLQDADTLIMHTDQLVEILKHLIATFPNIERVTSYARSKTLVKKTPDELKELRSAGLSRLHIGIESGDDDVLAYVNKGVDSEEHILAGKKAAEAGFELSLYVMPGLGGRTMWEHHALNTARVLNEINPAFIRMRPVVPMHGTPLLEAYKAGEFDVTSPHERLREIKLMIENLNVTSRVSFDQITNTAIRSGENVITLFRHDTEGYKFPDEKSMVLETIEEGLRLDEKALMDVSEWAGRHGVYSIL